uniref:Uncharacterized protein n=1 Tax=Cacopsylla melanoneura TaxID=428564 RepID=A0A8D8XRW1_9HEMI
MYRPKPRTPRTRRSETRRIFKPCPKSGRDRVSCVNNRRKRTRNERKRKNEKNWRMRRNVVTLKRKKMKERMRRRKKGVEMKVLDKEALRKEMKKKMAVKAGKETPVDPADAKIENYRQRKMAERLIPNKYKRLYKIMMDGRKKRVKELNHLKLKRYTLDELKLEQERVDKEKMIWEQEQESKYLKRTS